MSYQAAINEAMALNKPEPILDTIELIFEPLSLRILLVSNDEDITATLETGETVLFRGTGAKIELPGKDDKGFQELTIAIPNVNLEASDFLQQVLDYEDEIICNYRPFLASDLSTPQMIPPMVLYLSEPRITQDAVQAKATFADILNKRFLTEKYTNSNFPGL